MVRRKTFIFTTLLTVASGLGVLAGIAIFLIQFFMTVQKSNNDEYSSPFTVGNILYISSYDPSYTIVQDQFNGLDDACKKYSIIYEVAYMDMKNYATDENYKNFYESLRYKIESTKKFDAIIVSDDDALGFIEAYGHQLFPETPVVFFGINNLEHAKKAAELPWITGFAEKIFVEDTIELAVEQNPRLGSITCLLDDSKTGQGDIVQFEEAIKKYPNLPFRKINISRYTTYQLAAQLLNLPDDTVIVGLSSLQDYAHYHGLSVFELVDFIQACAGDIPVYRTNITGIGYGFVGGKVFNHYYSATEAVRAVSDILNGTPVKDIPLTLEMDGQWIFDWSVLKRLGLKTSVIPKDAVLMKKPLSFIELYKYVIVPFILIVSSLILLLIVFSAGYQRSKKTNSVMMIMNKRMRQTNKDLMDSKTKLTFVANYDNLTKLPNRAYGEAEIRKSMKSGIPFSLFLMDIDDFKNYNDSYGHACGDFVLQEYGRRLAKLAMNNDYFAARYGGDEFIFIHKCGHIEKNGDEIEELRRVLNEPVVFENITLDITATLGYADSSADMSYDELITNADIAMYEAKKAGKSSIIAFVPEMKESMIKKNKIVEILKDECSRGGFEIRYQPQVSTESGEVYGYEALVRLQDYQVGPGDFIPVAEDCGFITQIGRIVTEKVLQQMDQWRSEGMELKKVAINYSNGQLVDDEYVNYLKELMDKYKISPELIEIEITESLFMGKKDRAKQLFDDLAAIGVGLALDDFGTGYSSLSYLTFVPAGKVKIDKSLVDNYLVDGKEKFIENIVHLVHDLGMRLTVEGVEHKWQYDKLQTMKCDYIQGYFFSKPMTAEAVPQFTVAL